MEAIKKNNLNLEITNTLEVFLSLEQLVSHTPEEGNYGPLLKERNVKKICMYF